MSVESIVLHSVVSLDPVRRRIEEAVLRAGGELREASSHLFQSGGKGIRPTLVVLSARAAAELGDSPRSLDDVYDVAAAAELIHVASLIHDDIIDGADTRRDRPSVNARWSNHTAVLAGDFLFAAAFSLLAPHASTGILTLMTAAIADMCHGEILQREQAFDPDLSETAYQERIRDKTASLISACCHAGARVAGGDPDLCADLAAFGERLGLAYQIADDVLDYCGPAEVLGKPAGADLAEGHVTLPIIFLLRSTDWRVRLGPRIASRSIDDATVADVRTGLEETGALRMALAHGRRHAEEATRHLEAVSFTEAGRLMAAMASATVERIR